MLGGGPCSPLPARALCSEVVDLSSAYPVGPCTEAEAQAREEVSRMAAACLGLALAKSTRARYESTLKVVVGGVETRVGAELLPIDNEAKFFAALRKCTVSPGVRSG